MATSFYFGEESGFYSTVETRKDKTAPSTFHVVHYLLILRRERGMLMEAGQYGVLCTFPGLLLLEVPG